MERHRTVSSHGGEVGIGDEPSVVLEFAGVAHHAQPS
jgi:hypothetical protein